MNNKMLIEVFVPVLGNTYEFWAPQKYNIACLTKLMVDQLKKQTTIFMPDDSTVMCDRVTGRILNYNMNLEQYAKQNQLKFMLI